MHITLIEPTWKHLVHLPGNLGALRVLRHLYPQATLTFVGDTDQFQSMQGMAPALLNACQFVPYPSAEDADTLPADVWRAHQKMKALPPPALKKADLIVFSSFTATSLGAVVRMGLAAKTLAYLHGNANEIGQWKSRNPLRGVFDLTSTVQAFVRQGGRLVVLENRLKTALEQKHPWMKGALFTVGHPLLESEAMAAKQGKTPQEPLRIGYAGLATKAKGFPEFLALANKLDQAAPGRFGFYAYGKLHPSCANLDQSVLKRSADQGLPRPAFVEGLQNLDFIFAWHGDEYYANAASGIVYDAINLGVPLLARKSEQIAEFHDRGAPIAIAVDTIDELVELVQNKAFCEAQYPSLLEGLGKAKSRLSTPALAAEMAAAVAGRQ